jgi:hypothetical protein
LTAQLQAEARQTVETVLALRLERWREARAEEEIRSFRELVTQNNRSAALALGGTLQKKYAGSKALAALDPPLETQLSELKSGSTSLKNIFLCDAKRLADGRVELGFDLSNERHLLELVNRGLPAWFTEADVDITLENDGRWERHIFLGETQFLHHHDGSFSILDDGGKRVSQKPRTPGKVDGSYGPVGGKHHYRLRAAAAGLSFQLDDEPPLVVVKPWHGGRLRWPGHNQPLPHALKVTGRLDPLWLSEMSEVASDRAKFLAGGVVEIKPRLRNPPRSETEPWMNAWGYGQEKESRSLAGWYEVGAAWTAEGNEFVSPRPKDKRETWVSMARPAAQTERYAQWAFDARLDSGQLCLEIVSGDFLAQDFIVLSATGVKIQRLETFNDKPGVHAEKEVRAQAALSGIKNGQWLSCQVLFEKTKLKVLINGVQVLEWAIPTKKETAMSFWVFPGSEVRLRNFKIHRN